MSYLVPPGNSLNDQSATEVLDQRQKYHQYIWDWYAITQIEKKFGVTLFKTPDRTETVEVVSGIPQSEEHSKTQESIDLPDEVVVQIFRHLNDLALSRVLCVSRQWRRIALDPKFFPKFNLEFDPIAIFKDQYPNSRVISAQDWEHSAFNLAVPDPLPEFRTNLAARRRFLENLEQAKTDKNEPENPGFEAYPFLQYHFRRNFDETKHLTKEYDLMVAPEGITFRNFVEKNQNRYLDFKTVLNQHGDMPISKGVWLIPRSIIHISKYCLPKSADALLKTLPYPDRPPYAVMQAYAAAMKVMYKIEVFVHEFARCKEELNKVSNNPQIGKFSRPILVGTCGYTKGIVVNDSSGYVGGEPDVGVVGVRKLL